MDFPNRHGLGVARWQAGLPFFRLMSLSAPSQRLAALAALGVVLAFAWFVWPTPYRYDRLSLGRGISYPVRIARASGHGEVLRENGWEPLGTAPETRPAQAPVERTLTPSELRILTAQAHISAWNDLVVQVYNGSELAISDVAVEVVVYEQGREVKRKQYPMQRGVYPDFELQPHTAGHYSFPLDITIQPPQEWSWSIVSAKGRVLP